MTSVFVKNVQIEATCKLEWVNHGVIIQSIHQSMHDIHNDAAVLVAMTIMTKRSRKNSA
jgi:hypothetical protein